MPSSRPAPAPRRCCRRGWSRSGAYRRRSTELAGSIASTIAGSTSYRPVPKPTAAVHDVSRPSPLAATRPVRPSPSSPSTAPSSRTQRRALVDVHERLARQQRRLGADVDERRTPRGAAPRSARVPSTLSRSNSSPSPHSPSCAAAWNALRRRSPPTRMRRRRRDRRAPARRRPSRPPPRHRSGPAPARVQPSRDEPLISLPPMNPTRR